MQLEAANNKSQKDNQILREQIFKLTAQAARAKVEKSDRAKLRNHVKRLYMNSFQETAISFRLANLPEPKEIVGGTRFDSKRIESMIARCGRRGDIPRIITRSQILTGIWYGKRHTSRYRLLAHTVWTATGSSAWCVLTRRSAGRSISKT